MNNNMDDDINYKALLGICLLAFIIDMSQVLLIIFKTLGKLNVSWAIVFLPAIVIYGIPLLLLLGVSIYCTFKERKDKK